MCQYHDTKVQCRRWMETWYVSPSAWNLRDGGGERNKTEQSQDLACGRCFPSPDRSSHKWEIWLSLGSRPTGSSSL